MTAVLRNLGTFYNATWRPAISALLANSSRPTSSFLVDGFGASLSPLNSGQGIKAQYTYGAYVYGQNGTQSHVYLPTDDPIITRLIALNLSLYLFFTLSGWYFDDPVIREGFLSPADALVHRFVQFSPQLLNATMTQLPGKAFVNLGISALDENVVKITISGDNHFSYSQYFGVAGPATTITVTSTVTSTVRDGTTPSLPGYLPSVVLFSMAAVIVLALMARRLR